MKRRRRKEGQPKRRRANPQRIAQKHQREQQEGRDRFKWPVGTTRARFAPSIDPNDEDFLKKIVQHFGFVVKGRKNTPIACFHYHSGKHGSACPVCLLHAWFIDHNSEDDRYSAYADKIFPSTQYIANVAIRSFSPTNCIKKTRIPMTIVNSIDAMLTDPETGDISDPVTGRDILVTRVGTAMQDTRYTVTNCERSKIKVPNWRSQCRDLNKDAEPLSWNDACAILQDNFPDVNIRKIVGRPKGNTPVTPARRKEAVATRKRKKKVEEEVFEPPIDPNTGEDLDWDEKEDGWVNPRTNDVWADDEDFAPPPEDWEPESEDEGDEEEEEDEDFDGDEEEEEEDDDDFEAEEEDLEEGDEDEEEPFDEEEEEDEDFEEEEEEEPKPRRRRKKKTTKKKATRKKSPTRKKKTTRKKTTKKRATRRAPARKKAGRKKTSTRKKAGRKKAGRKKSGRRGARG